MTLAPPLEIKLIPCYANSTIQQPLYEATSGSGAASSESGNPSSPSERLTSPNTTALPNPWARPAESHRPFLSEFDSMPEVVARPPLRHPVTWRKRKQWK